MNVNRYEIKPEGLGEINIEQEDKGGWVKYEDIKYLLKMSCASCEILWTCSDVRKHPEFYCENHRIKQ